MEDVIELRAPVFSEPPNSGLVADIYETSDGQYVISIPVPGLKSDAINMKIDRYSITVSTEPTQAEVGADRKYVIREIPIRPLTRTFDFPFEIDREKVKVTLNLGMLLICVPKPVTGKRKVPVEQAR
jgi:HSP20 family molecular chaperone IbpA